MYKEFERYHIEREITKDINYEDIAYFLKELVKEENGVVDNPAAYEYEKKLLPGWETKSKLFQLLLDSLRYISDNIASFLDSIQPHSTKYLNFLNECYSDESATKIQIFTLNHDLLLENYFKKSQLPYIDGFDTSEPELNFNPWNPHLLENDQKKFINLYKLHGSINWHRITEQGNHWYGDKFGIPLASFNGRIRTTSGKYFETRERIILIGTYNKVEEYQKYLFMDLQCLFYKILNQSSRLIISGYSFGDEGINRRIIEWVYKDRNRKIILVDPYVSSLRDIAKPAIGNKWTTWIKDDIFRIVTDDKGKGLGIEDVTWDIIKTYLKN